MGVRRARLMTNMPCLKHAKNRQCNKLRKAIKAIPIHKSSQFKSDRRSRFFLFNKDARVADFTHLCAKMQCF